MQRVFLLPPDLPSTHHQLHIQQAKQQHFDLPAAKFPRDDSHVGAMPHERLTKLRYIRGEHGNHHPTTAGQLQPPTAMHEYLVDRQDFLSGWARAKKPIHHDSHNAPKFVGVVQSAMNRHFSSNSAELQI